ncbi:MAG: UvrD-helicase domain-containing protein [Dehalococcoides mccartyi]|uniref:ATP-dependent helicase n=1 Tax=Dehalococcoides mccartyi TaxID=61435 RepID=UPI0025C779E1|nr:UvrD-helicase domain-containing protein [Dehalococcoides mccartyi]MDN4186682.1 UvrD-helicase domain-containing protein [Dehalococcoides mccartyi]
MQDILTGLNPAQKQAVEAVEGPVLILAGPGSGKTRVITHRIAYLIKVVGINPHRIMAVTFTNKAAREMETRLNLLAPSAAGRLTMGTFHAICARILRQDGLPLGVPADFVIYDDDDQQSLIKQAMAELELDPKRYPPASIRNAISQAKSQLVLPAYYFEKGRSYFEEVVGRVYELYEKRLKQNKALDFDDLLLKVVQLFKQHPEVLSRYQERYLHVMVDEFQDTNLVQYELVKMLSAKYKNICVVGDPDQSIYSWRSADLRNVFNFETDNPGAKVILLEQNYRSTKNILEAASCVIAPNSGRKPISLWTENESGQPIAVVETFNEQEEAQFVVSEIEKLTRYEKFSPGDIAILYRTNAQSRALEEAFIRYGMPYRLVSGTRFYQRREVKDIVAYLRLLQNPQDSVSLQRVINIPTRGIGAKTLSDLGQFAREQDISLYESLVNLSDENAPKSPIPSRGLKPLTDFGLLLKSLITDAQNLSLLNLLDRLLEGINYREFLFASEDGEERWDNILELRTVAQQYQEIAPPEGLSAFLESVALVSDLDSLEEGVSAVTLITLHQAKGLEYPVVFMVGMEEGVLPHSRSFDDPAQMQEERRLCYVGVTRARKRLYLVRAFRRSLMGQSNVNEPSRYLKDIPQSITKGREKQPLSGQHTAASAASPVIKQHLQSAGMPVKSASPPAPKLLELEAGDRVLHPQFGEGIVTSINRVKNDAEVMISFHSVGMKRLMLSFARLTKLEN